MTDVVTPPFRTHSEYLDYVSMLARNGLEAGDSPRVVADSVVVDTENVGDEKTFQYSAEPYVDHPASQVRLWPSEICRGAMRDMPVSWPDDLRSLAVEILKVDLYDAYMEHENRSVPTIHRYDDYDAPL